MKTLNLLAAIILTTITSFSFALTTSVSSTNATLAKKQISKIIASEITFPEIRSIDVSDFEGEVLVSVGFDQDDHLVITQINATDERLKAHVKKQLGKLVIRNANKSLNDELLNFKFVFKKKQ
jgi:acid phosphatase class B